MVPQFFLSAFDIKSFEEEFSISKAVCAQMDERLRENFN
jgi:hypothetical protein